MWKINGCDKQFKTTMKNRNNITMDQRSGITERWWGGIKVPTRKRPLGGNGRYKGACRILGRRLFLPWPHLSPNRVHPPTPNPPPYAVNFVIIVIDGACIISGRRRFLPQPCPRYNRVRPPTPTPPPYAVFVVVIVIDGARSILAWQRFLPWPCPRRNRVCPPTPPPPPYAVVIVVFVI